MQLHQRTLIAFGLCVWGYTASAIDPPATVAVDSTAVRPTSQIVIGSQTIIVVKGAEGQPEFGEQFQEAGDRWCRLADSQKMNLVKIGWTNDSGEADRIRLQKAIESFAHSGTTEDLWLVLLGHGTFSNNTAKFNLVGPDVTAKELSDWLKPLNSRCVVFNCFSSSGPFLTALSGNNRIIVTATKSGAELNFTRFGSFLAGSLQDLSADVDHDQEVSLLEIFLSAASQTERFYRESARLATEHALLDDNGDRIGTSSDFFRGTRPAKAAEAGKQLDGRHAARVILYSSPTAPQLTPTQKLQRDVIEQQLDQLRARKPQLALAAYEDELEKLLLQLAELYPH